MKLDGCTALITGASAGLGAEFARQLRDRAVRLVLVARRLERLEALRNELTARRPELKVYVRRADLTQAKQVNALCEWLAAERLEVDLLINNAGIGDHGPFTESDTARLEAMLQLNIVALTSLTRRFAAAMADRKRGAILNVSSTAGFLALPEMAVYAASKAYVTSFSDALRTELRGQGIAVTALCPGPVHTEFGEVATRPGAKRREAPEILYVSAERVVRLGLRAVERNQPIVIPGAAIRTAMAVARIVPAPLLRLAGSAYGRTSRSR